MNIYRPNVGTFLRTKYLTIVLVMFGQLLLACSKAQVVEKLTPVVSTVAVSQYSQAQKEAQTQSLRYSAVVAPVMQIDLAFRSGGYVNYIAPVKGAAGQSRLIHDGDLIGRGTLLASIKQGDYDARYRQQVASLEEVRASDQRARAGLAEMEAALKQAEEEGDRTSRLYATNSVTKPEFDAAAAKVVVAQARLKEAEAQLSINRAARGRTQGAVDEAQLARADCQLRAPCDGILVKRNIEKGSLVSSGTIAMTLADPSAIKVVFGVPDVKLKGLKLGQSLTCTSEAASGIEFKGKITDIAPGADAKGRVFNIEVSLANLDHKLKPGMVVSIAVDDHQDSGTADKNGLVQSTEKLVVPLSAVVRSTRDPDGYAVFVTQKRDGKVTVDERQVHLGDVFGQMISVRDGLSPGDVVVTSGSAQIGSGQEVRLLN